MDWSCGVDDMKFIEVSDINCLVVVLISLEYFDFDAAFQNMGATERGCG